MAEEEENILKKARPLGRAAAFFSAGSLVTLPILFLTCRITIKDDIALHVISELRILEEIIQNLVEWLR
jgi:hypothetical protein